MDISEEGKLGNRLFLPSDKREKRLYPENFSS